MSADEGGSSGEWQQDELVHVVAEYMVMLHRQEAGLPFVKADHNRAVQAAAGRSRGSVEFKFCNISAVLRDDGRDWVSGYLPRSNYQAALKAAVDRYLSQATGPSRSDDIGEGDVGMVAAVREADASFLKMGDLWERATGGTAVAVSPMYDGLAPWPVGPSVVGADEVVDALLEAVNRDTGGRQLVFLIGGPGNGKSALARRVAARLHPVASPTPDLAHRLYQYESDDGAPLVVLNDATIPAENSTAPQGQLVRDIQRVLASGAFLLANINRGVLYEELAHCRAVEASVGPEAAEAEQILLWLGEVSSGSGDDGGGGIKPVRQLDRNGGLIVRVVLMDACSLFEERPLVMIDATGPRMTKGYSIFRLSRRTAQDADFVPAAGLLKEFHQALDPDLRLLPDWHPVRANVEALDSGEVQAGILCLLRAAELAAGRRFSYREVWGAFVRAIVGDLPERMRSGQANELLAVGPASANDPMGRLAVLAALANLRLHQSLVGAPPLAMPVRGAQMRPPTRNPVLRLTRRVDPALDATPDWIGPVNESMAFPDEHLSPLNTLLSRADCSELVDCVTDFDRVLDQAYVELVQSAPDSRHAAADSWYGGYLLRFFAIANSRPAFLTELDLWTQAWSQRNWPRALKEPLRTLLFPRRTQDSEMLLPVLEARAHPVVGASEAPRLVRVIETHRAEFSRVRRGESLFVALAAGESSRAELELDFDLLREALTCADGQLGISDRARATFPRLERFRANLLRPELDFDYALVEQMQESPIDLVAL